MIGLQPVSGDEIMNGMKVRRVALSLHNWMGLLVGIQIVFWFVGGLVMTVLPLDLVRGERSMAEQAPASATLEQVALLGSRQELNSVRSITARQVAGIPVLQVTDLKAKTLIYHAETAALLSPIDAGLAAKVALNDFSYRVADADVAVLATEWLTEEPGDFRRTLPVWQVTLDDPDGTRLYVSPDTGRVLARRNDYWRVFDFFWMLHIMDYDEREDFNNPLLIVTTITSTLFVLTGIILLYFRFWPQRKKRGAA